MKKFDFLIVGSGFSGSISAMALVKSGYSVCLVEKESHPRFAIGESSTPVADMILRDLGDRYDLPFLKKLSRYGEWQKSYPGVVCGLKRGFSYYPHKRGEEFTSDENHSNELLVAASENDENSDTNWLRSDVDQFLVQKAAETGVSYSDQTEVQKLSRDAKNENWSVYLETPAGLEEITCDWIIDATGGPQFSSKFFNTMSTSDGFLTNSSTVYTHFEGTGRWLDYLDKNGFKISDYPYNPDFSALHHLIEEGWIWMLRFNNDRLSAGVLLDGYGNESSAEKDAETIWRDIISQYPSLAELLNEAELSERPNRFFKTGRLQRRLNTLYGNGWVVLPHTAGFVDPLHSTGIAHTLSGVEYLLDMFTNHSSKKMKLEIYQDKIFNELEFNDLLISICYRTRTNFKLFTAASMLYFVAAVRYERSRLKGDIPDHFLCAGEAKIKELVQKSFEDIRKIDLDEITEPEAEIFIQKIRKRIEPYNTVGLMNPDAKNMYKHTAVTL